jgi:hypothetical protein
MRRVLAVVLSVLAVLAFVAPAADAQAPTSKVTITGLVDNITSYTRNLGNVDLNYSRAKDTEWYARTRVRPDITGEVGTAKFVLGLEIDSTWGQTAAQDTNVCLGTACQAAGTNIQRGGTSSGWDLNTDVVGSIEVKWAYTEFDMPGIPFATRVRLGAQPWGNAATYKLAALANGDFAGAHVNFTFTPEIRLLLTYGQAEEESTGVRDGFLRGEDWALITSLEVTPFKGLDIKPVWAWFHATGATNGAARQARGGLGTGLSNAAGVIGTGLAGSVTNPYCQSCIEERHTVGVDARLRMGPFSLDPTLLYQFGHRELVDPLTQRKMSQDRSSYLVDVRGGFQAGPLLLEAAGIYTPGNAANSDVRNARTKVRYYEPISTDTSYYGTWAEHWALGIDYFNIIHSSAGGINPGVAIGYDKYGLIRFGARASYNVTPAFTVRAAVTANWTDEEVDTSAASTKAVATGITPGDFRGDDRYLGTEIDLGFQWRFAPGLTLDLVGAYTFVGDALKAGLSTNANTGVAARDQSPHDIQTVTARVRYNF